MKASEEVKTNFVIPKFQRPIEKMDPLRYPNLKKGFCSTKASNKRIIWPNSQGQYIKSVHGQIGTNA